MRDYAACLPSSDQLIHTASCDAVSTILRGLLHVLLVHAGPLQLRCTIGMLQAVQMAENKSYYM